MKGGRKWLPMFEKLEAEFGVPARYMLALAGRESRWNPRKVSGIKGEATPAEIKLHAVGLLQITRKVVDGYNAAHKTSWRKRDMLRPELNARVAAWQLERILRVIPTDWNSARSIAVLTQAWNSGWGASRRILAALLVAGHASPTVDDVKKFAQGIIAGGKRFEGLQAKSYRYLASRKTGWAKATARDMLGITKAKPGAERSRTRDWLDWLGIGVVFATIAKMWRDR